MLQPPAEKLVPELIKTEWCFSKSYTQNKRMVGGKLWRSSGPLLLIKQGHTQWAAKNHLPWTTSRDGDQPPLWAICDSAQSSSQWNPQCFLTFSQFCASVCAHCSPHLLVTLLLRQLRMSLSLFCSPCPADTPPARQPSWFLGLFLPTLILVELHQALASPLLQPARDFGWHQDPLGYQPLLPVWCHHHSYWGHRLPHHPDH